MSAIQIRYAILSVGLAILSGVTIPASAQSRPHGLPDNYPEKPIRIIVGASAGGGTDIVARLVMQRIGERWDHPFLVENKVSVMGSVMALDYVSKEPADGYTMNVVSGSTYLNAALVSMIPKDVMKVLDPVAQFTATPFLFVVTKSLPPNSIMELLQYARANPGKLNYASSGIGGSAHLASEYFKHEFGLDITHIPYKGIGPGYIDLIAGRVHMTFGTTTSALPLVKKGDLKLMAVTSAERLKELPDVPAMSESIPGFEYVSFFGMVAPAGVKKPIVNALNEGINVVLDMPDVRKRLSTGGSVVVQTTPEGFQKAMESFVGRAEKLVKEAKLDLRKER